MVRTRDTASVKVSGGKASRKISHSATLAATSKGATLDNKDKYGGGNPYCPRETPVWQKSITCFFPTSSTDGETTGCSSAQVSGGGATTTSVAGSGNISGK